VIGEQKYTWIAIIISRSRRCRGRYTRCARYRARCTRYRKQVFKCDCWKESHGLFSIDTRKQEATEGSAARVDARKNFTFLGVRIWGV